MVQGEPAVKLLWACRECEGGCLQHLNFSFHCWTRPKKLNRNGLVGGMRNSPEPHHRAEASHVLTHVVVEPKPHKRARVHGKWMVTRCWQARKG